MEVSNIQSYTEASGHMWLLNILNVASATEGIIFNFICH